MVDYNEMKGVIQSKLQGLLKFYYEDKLCLHSYIQGIINSETGGKKKKTGNQYIPVSKRTLPDKYKEKIKDAIVSHIESSGYILSSAKGTSDIILGILRDLWSDGEYTKIVQMNERYSYERAIIQRGATEYLQDEYDKMLSGEYENPIERCRELRELTWLYKIIKRVKELSYEELVDKYKRR